MRIAVFCIVAAAVALGVLYQAIGLRRSRRQFTPSGVLIDVGGHRLHAICRGQGSPVVLLESAIAGSSLSWVLVQPEVARFTRVCAYDRAGLAWSDAPSCPRTFDRIVDELSTLLGRVADRERYVLVGHSFGAFVVSACAARQPERVAGVVLVDPPMEWLTPTPEHARLLRGGIHLSRLGAILARLGVVRVCLALLTGGAAGIPRGFVRMFGPTAAHMLERLVGEVRKLPPHVHPIVQGLWCEPKCFRALGDHLSALARAGASMDMPIPPREVPFVVISSGQQASEQIAAQARLADGSVHGRHVIAGRSGHWIPFDEPDVVVAAIRELVVAPGDFRG